MRMIRDFSTILFICKALSFLLKKFPERLRRSRLLASDLLHSSLSTADIRRLFIQNIPSSSTQRLAHSVTIAPSSIGRRIETAPHHLLYVITSPGS